MAPISRAIWQTAKLLIEQYGGEAALRAAQRVDKLMDEGDIGGVAVWRRRRRRRTP